MAFDIAKKITFVMGLTGDDKVRAGVKGVTDQMSATDKAWATAKMAVTGLLGAMSVGVFTSWIKSGIDAADAAFQISQKTGLATKDVAGLQLAFKLGIGSSDGMTASMAKLSKGIAEGNTAFQVLGVRTKNADGSLRSTKDVLYDTADAFAGIKDGAGKTALAMDIFGKSGAELLPMLNGGADGLREMAEMAEKLGLVIDKDTGEAADRFNDTLDLLGMSGKGVASQLAAQLLPTLNSLAGGLLDNVTKGDALKRTADFLGTGLKLLYTVIAGGIQVVATLGQGFGALGAAIAAVLRGDFSQAKTVIGDFMDVAKKDWTATIANIGSVWDGSAAKTAEAGAKVVKAQREMSQAAKDAEAAAKAAADAKKAEAAAYAAFSEKSADLVLALKAELEQGAKLTASDKLIIEAKQKFTGAELEAKLAVLEVAKAFETQIAARQAANKLIEEGTKLSEAFAAEQAKTLDSLAEGNLKLAEENDKLRMGEQAWGQYQRVKLLARADEIDALLAQTEFNAGLAEEAQLLRERAALLADGSAIKAYADEAKAASDEWSKANDQIGQGLTDSLFRAFESGADFFSTFWSGVKNTLKTTVLKIAVEAVIDWGKLLLAQGLNALGLTGGAGGGAGSLMSAGSTAGSIGSLFQAGSTLQQGYNWAASLFGAGYSGVGASTVGGVTMTPAAMEAMIGSAGYGSSAAGAAALAGSGAALGGGLAAGGGAAATVGSSGIAAGAVLGEGAAAAGAASAAGSTSALSAMGPYGWIAAAVIAVLALTADGGTPHRGSIVTADDVGARTGGHDPTNILGNFNAGIDDALKSVSTGAVDMLNDLSSMFGGARNFSAEAKFGSDGDNASFGGFKVMRDGAFVSQLAGTINNDAKHYDKNAGVGFEQFTADIGSAVRSAIDAMGLPDWVEGFFADLGDSPTLQQLATAMGRITAAGDALSDHFEPLGGVLGRVAALSLNAKLELAGMVGGLDQLVAKSQSFVANFYSKEEQASLLARQVLQTGEQAGIGDSALNYLGGIRSLQDFRALAETIDVSSELGRKQLAFVLNVQEQIKQLGGFAADENGEFASSIKEMAQYAIGTAFGDFAATLDKLQAQADGLAGGDDAAVSQQELDAAVVDTATAASTTAEAATKTAEATEETVTAIKDAITELKTVVANTAATVTAVAGGHQQTATLLETLATTVAGILAKAELAAVEPEVS